MGVTHCLSLGALADFDIDPLHKSRKCHREVQIAFRNVQINGIGNQGPGLLGGYNGFSSTADSVMVLVQSGAGLNIVDSKIWKQGGPSIAPWLNDQGHNAALDVVGLPFPSGPGDTP